MNTLTKTILTVIISLLVFAGIHFSGDIISDSTTPKQPMPDLKTESEVRPADSKELNTLSDFNDAIVEIAEKTNPAVVTITTRQTVTMRQRSPFSLFFDDPRFDQERQFQREGLGSGVIVSEEGHVLTNFHVIENADEINVITFGDEEISAEIVGADPASDVAVLKLSSDETFPTVKLGDSESLRVGELVFAIGSPLMKGLAHTVSMGIVSAKGRTSLGLNPYESYIQTDAAINPGNSGGALVNFNGELIGINTAIASRTGGSMGIGFAIPVNMAKSVMEQLINEGRVVRGYLGIEWGGMVDKTMARALGMNRNYGIVISNVVQSSPADKAGLEEGDVILKADGKEIRDWNAFRVMVGEKKPGDTIELEIFRDGNFRNLTVELGEQPEEMTAAFAPDRGSNMQESLGFSVENLTGNVKRQLGLDESVTGVIVTDIDQTSHAYRQGLRTNDIITRIGDKNISTAREFMAQMNAVRSSDESVALVRIIRNGQFMFVAFEIS